jgi:hypothetical protein
MSNVCVCVSVWCARKVSAFYYNVGKEQHEDTPDGKAPAVLSSWKDCQMRSIITHVGRQVESQATCRLHRMTQVWSQGESGQQQERRR